MKVIFMGTPDFAAVSLQRLIDDGHEILAVYTQPDKPKGRGYKLTPPPVKELAMQYGLPVFQPTRLKDGKVAAQMREFGPDIIVVAAYGRLLQKDILELPPLGCVNVHGSLLPRYRGAAPIQWAVINGEKEAGVTTMYMAQGLDCGDMILKASTAVGENETSGELYDRLAVLGADCLSETMALFAREWAQGRRPKGIPQDESDATHAPMLEKSMGSIDFSKPAQQVHNLIRGMNPWPSAYTRLDGKLLKVHRSVLAEGEGAPGEILDPQTFTVACGKGAIQLTEVQLEGAKRMDASVFLRGHPLQKGTVLGVR